MEKGNVDGAQIYAENAIRKRIEQMNYLRLARGSTPWWRGLTPRPRCSPSTSQWAISSPYSCATAKPFLYSRRTPPPSTHPHRRRFERAVTRSTTRSLSSFTTIENDAAAAEGLQVTDLVEDEEEEGVQEAIEEVVVNKGVGFQTTTTNSSDNIDNIVIY
ncbi:hypothetical protein FF1_041130 [Malus domestica]